jgi:hypothetical protein
LISTPIPAFPYITPWGSGGRGEEEEEIKHKDERHKVHKEDFLSESSS